MTEQHDHVLPSANFDRLPTEIYHQVGAFLFDSSFSAEPTQSSLSAVYFYFYLLSLLNSHMYDRVHASEFWQYDRIQIVLRNKEMFNRSVLLMEQPTTHDGESTSGTKTNVDGTTKGNEGEIEELKMEEKCEGDHFSGNVQFKYLYELIKVCQFRSIQFVGLTTTDYAIFIHDLLKKLCVCDPHILNNLQSLSIHCTVVDFKCLRAVLQSCGQLREFRLFFGVGRHMGPKFISSSENTQLCAKLNDSVMTEYPCLEIIEYHRSKEAQHQAHLACGFLQKLCRSASNVRSLSIRSLPATNELFSVVGKHCKQLESFSFVTMNPRPYNNSFVVLRIDNDSVLELIKGCPKISTLVLEHYMVVKMNELVPQIIEILKGSLKCLKVQVKQGNVTLDTPTSNTIPSVLEEISYTSEYHNNEALLVSIGDVSGNSCVRSLSAGGCNISVKSHELHLFSRMQCLAFRLLSGDFTMNQVLSACSHLQQLTIQSRINPTDVSDICVSCPGLVELSINCNDPIIIPTILRNQPECLKKLSILGVGFLGIHDTPNSVNQQFYKHINLEEFTYKGYERRYLQMMLEHCPKLHTFKCAFSTPPIELIFRCCPNLKSVSVPYSLTKFPHPMNQLRFLTITGNTYYQNKEDIELNAVETIMALIHCPSIESVQIAHFFKRISFLVDFFANDIELKYGDNAPVGVACRFIIEKLAKSAFEKSEGLTPAEREEAQLRIEHCLAMYCDNNSTDDALFNTNTTDSGRELNLRRLIALIRCHYEILQEEHDQFDFLIDM